MKRQQSSASTVKAVASPEKRLYEALCNWKNLSFEIKLDYARQMNDQYPGAIGDWEEELELLRVNPFFVPSSIACHLTQLRDRDWETINAFIASELQSEPNAELLHLSFNGQKVHLHQTLRSRLQTFRTKAS